MSHFVAEPEEVVELQASFIEENLLKQVSNETHPGCLGYIGVILPNYVEIIII